MSIDVSSFVGGGRREAPREPPAPAPKKLDLKPTHVRCTYCKTWADMDAAAKQKYKCLNCGAPLEVKVTAERVQDDGQDFGAMMRRRLKERMERPIRMKR